MTCEVLLLEKQFDLTFFSLEINRVPAVTATLLPNYLNAANKVFHTYDFARGTGIMACPCGIDGMIGNTMDCYSSVTPTTT